MHTKTNLNASWLLTLLTGAAGPFKFLAESAIDVISARRVRNVKNPWAVHVTERATEGIERHMTSLVSFVQFASMQLEWNTLLEQSLNPTFFLSYEWISCWWQIFGEGSSLFIIQVRDESGALLALAPFCIQQQYVLKYLPYRSLRMIGTNQANPDYLGLIVHKGHGAAATDSILRFINEQKDKWDELDLESLPLENEASRGLLQRLRKDADLLCLNNDQKIMYIDLPQDMDTLLASFSSKHRYNLRRRFRQFAQNYNGTFGKADTVESALSILDQLFHLHHLRAEAIGRTEAFTDPRIRQLHADFVREHFNSGRIYLYYLKIGDTMQACLYGFRDDERFYFYQMGYNPEFDHISLGTTMMFKSIEFGIMNKFKYFDFLRGEEPYKKSWTKSERSVKFVKYYRKNSKGLFLYGYRILRSTVRRAWLLAVGNAKPVATVDPSY
jgi:CelD/BcsL family acetyltransferase involved in cellulose biosynthesis